MGMTDHQFAYYIRNVKNGLKKQSKLQKTEKPF
jgi:hypothetical protein